MRAVRGLVLAGGLIVGLAGQASAQVSLNIGNPYTGQGISINTPGVGGYGYSYGAAGLSPGYGYGYGYGSPGFYPGYGYRSGYSSYSGIGPGLGYTNNYQSYSSTGYLAGPGVIGYNSGYAGINPAPIGYPRAYYGTVNSGFSPFRAIGRMSPFRY